nr:hypothetical protein [Acidimicrobiia bacterium]
MSEPASEQARRGEPASEALRRFSWWPMGVLALVNLVDQVDMAILRGVLPILEDEWSLSDLQ